MGLTTVNKKLDIFGQNWTFTVLEWAIVVAVVTLLPSLTIIC